MPHCQGISLWHHLITQGLLLVMVMTMVMAVVSVSVAMMMVVVLLGVIPLWNLRRKLQFSILTRSSIDNVLSF
jgi:hypothetical protein